MRLAIVSDIHDNLWTLRAALQWLDDTDAMIVCGDLCSPFVMERLAAGFHGPIHCVFGNNDGDLFRITATAARFAHVKLWGAFADIPPDLMDGKRVAVTHYPEIAHAVAASGIYDLVCYGHSHRLEWGRVGRTVTINPGELMGGLTGLATFVVYDTAREDVAAYEVSYVQFGRRDDSGDTDGPTSSADASADASAPVSPGERRAAEPPADGERAVVRRREAGAGAGASPPG